MKKLTAILLSVLVLFSLASCSSNQTRPIYDDGKYAEAENYQTNSSIAFDSTADYVVEMPMVEEAPMEKAESYEPSAPTGDKASSSVTDGRKIIYSASFSIQTKEYDNSVRELKKLCEEYGAWFENSNSYGTAESGNRSSHYTIRVPVSNYKAFISKQDTVGIVVSSSENNRDVTEAYTDIEARLASATLREERVLKILENADKLDDVLALERELSDIRYEIESMTGSLRKYDSLVSYSTVNVNINEVTVYVPKQPVTLTFGERIAKGFKSGIESFTNGFENFVVFVSYNLIGIVIWIVIIIVVTIVVRHKVKKYKKKKEEEK